MPIPAHLVNVELERAVLGRMLTAPEDIVHASGMTPEMFTIGKHRLLFDVVCRMYEAGKPVSIVTLGAELHNSGRLQDAGGVSGLADLTEFAVRAHDIDFALSKLADLWAMRRALSDLQKAVERLESPGSTLSDLSAVEEIARDAGSFAGNGAPRLRTVREVVQEYPGGLNAFLRPFTGDQYMRFPWGQAEDMIGGLWPGEVLVLGGRPGSGKSACALQLARHNAQFGIKPGIANLEMSDASTIYRTICARAGVAMSRFRMGRCTEQELMNLHRELTRFAGENIRLCDRATMTIGQIRAMFRKAVASGEVNMAIIDYLQLAESGSKMDNRAQEVSFISRQVKLMAMELKIPVVVLAQLSRKNEDQNREPGLSDLKESGAIEQDADVVMFTYRKTEIVAQQPQHSYSLLFPKARNGQMGRFRAIWDSTLLEFREMITEQ